jgi:HSP20 family protein
MNMAPKGIRDVKSLRAVKGVGSLNIKSSHSAESKRNAKLFQLGVEKDSLMKALEQFERQKAEIEKRLLEIAQAIQDEGFQFGGQQGGENQEISPVPEKKDEQYADDQNKKEEQKEEQKVELDFHVGKFSFGDLIQGIGNFIDFVSKMEEAGKDEVRREGEFTSPSGRVKAVYGLSIKEGIGGTPIVEPFGNVKRTAQGPVVEEQREPLVDIFDEEDHVSVIIELPGVQVSDIHTEVKGDILTLSAANNRQKYYKEVVLPKNVDPSTAKRKYTNGILEIRMDKK